MFPDLVRRASTTGLRRGLAGSRPWIIVGVVSVGIRVLMRLAQNEEQVMYRTLIRPGDVFELVTRPNPKAK